MMSLRRAKVLEEKQNISKVTRTIVDLCLTLGAKYRATEPIVKEDVVKSDEILSMCKDKFSTFLHNNNLNFILPVEDIF